MDVKATIITIWLIVATATLAFYSWIGMLILGALGNTVAYWHVTATLLAVIFIGWVGSVGTRFIHTNASSRIKTDSPPISETGKG